MRKTKKQRIADKRTKIKNRKLVNKYPWLLPRNRWTDKVPDDYDYSYTELDAMPDGWRKAFGMMMVKEINDELRKFNCQDKYRIIQIKEKFSELRWYDGGQPKDSKIDKIIHKYEVISQNVCMRCGKLDSPVINDGWLSTYCFKCFCKIQKNREKYYKNRDDFTPKTMKELEELYERFKEDDGIIPNSYKINHFGKDGGWTEEVDISDTVNKLRKVSKLGI